MRNFIILIALLLVVGIGLWAYKNSEKLGLNFRTTEIQDAPIDLLIKKFITSQLVTDIYPQSKVFCSYHTYGTEKEAVHNYTYAYVWAYCEEFYLQNGKLAMGQGISYPIRITFEEIDGELTAQGYDEPISGDGYAQSIRDIFPAKYAAQAIKGYDVKKFSPNPEEQAKMYFSFN
jgi:hypothetical protein